MICVVHTKTTVEGAKNTAGMRSVNKNVQLQSQNRKKYFSAEFRLNFTNGSNSGFSDTCVLAFSIVVNISAISRRQNAS